MNQYATYSPEDNKIRLYVGRVPRDEYEKLRADGWTATPKQNCNFVATWTPSRRDTALEYGGGVIEDEDQPAQDRAADRAERFSSYRDKREGEAIGHADRFDSGPQAHGYQSAARAERNASRHDRQAGHAVDAWSKAEYWQERTAGVISHALYISRPDVRMGRIKTLEAELRKCRAEITERTECFARWKKIAAMTDAHTQDMSAKHCADYEHGQYKHPITGEELSLYRIAESEGITGAQVAALWLANHTEPAQENDWTIHLTLRLAYENQMLESQGGRAAHVEMICGGFIGGRQIYRVNKSNVTGRVVSVALRVPKVGSGWHYRIANVPGANYALEQMDTERLPAGAYRPPTPDELIAYEASRKAEKASKPKAESIPLINPTDADAERLQAIWNAREKEAKQISRVIQAQYSANSGGTYAACEAVTINEHGLPRFGCYRTNDNERCMVFKVRSHRGRVVVLIDKPQKPLPFAAMEAARVKQPTVETMRAKLPDIMEELRKPNHYNGVSQLLSDASYVGWVDIQSISQIHLTDAGKEAWKAFQAEAAPVNPNAGIVAAYPGGRW